MADCSGSIAMTNLGATSGRELCGKLLDNRYRVESKLGAGGMAIVYLASDERLGRQVVIKAPLEVFLTVPGFRERFAQEIQALIQLDNPFIGKILDRGEVDGLPYAVLQYLAGGSLRDRVDAVGGKLTAEQLREWLPRVADALDFIHSREFLHRDIKPGNILFDTNNNVYLADFGIAKVLGGKEFTNLTETGTLPGTVAYMAPEAGRGGSPGPAYDQYALAVVVYEALSGDLPHDACETAIAGLVQKITQNPVPIERVSSHLPIGVCRAVMKALSSDPEARFASCREFAGHFVAGIETDPAVAFIEQEMDTVAPDAVHLDIADDRSVAVPPAPRAEAEDTFDAGVPPTDTEATLITHKRPAPADQPRIMPDTPAAQVRPAPLGGRADPLNAALTFCAPQLDPASVVDIVFDEQVRNAVGSTTRRVRVYCLVMGDGSVRSARVLQVDPGIPLDSANQSFKKSMSQSAIDSWRFRPASRDGASMTVWYVVSIVYEPRR